MPCGNSQRGRCPNIQDSILVLGRHSWNTSHYGWISWRGRWGQLKEGSVERRGGRGGGIDGEEEEVSSVDGRGGGVS